MCQLGKRCHFAHGLTQLQEFKSLRSQFKQQTDGFNQARLLPRNYKTQLCRFNDGGFCKFEDKCTFAHGQTQLKSQPKGGNFQQSQTQQLMQLQMMQQMGNNNMANPQNMMNPMNPMNPMMKMNPMMNSMMNPMNQVNPQSMMQGNVYQNMMLQNMMQQQQQNYQFQLMQQQQQNQDQNVETIKKLEFIIPQLQKFHQNDSDFDTILQSADVLLKNKDLMNAAEKLNLIMHREDVSPEEEQFYQNLINEANEQIKQIPQQPNIDSQQQNFLQQQKMFQQMSQFNGMGQMGNVGSFNGMNMSQFEANQNAKKQKTVINQQEQSQGIFEVIQKKPEVLQNQQNNFSEDDISDDDDQEILQSPFQNNQ